MRNIEDALLRIATALESMETNLDRIERNTAPQEQKLPENQDDVEKLFQVHSFYCTRIMDIISDEKSDAFKKAKEFRTLLKESMEALEALSQK
jgi:hypothetical protein